MISIEKPDFEIRIGIKDKEVIRVDWSEMAQFEKTGRDENLAAFVTEYFRQAIKFIKRG